MRNTSTPLFNYFIKVTLLGQNVNSYRDLSDKSFKKENETEIQIISKGFKSNYKPRIGGRQFVDLLDLVSKIDPEMRIRFTSPHPKQFPDDLLALMKERPNIARTIHLPAQSGSVCRIYFYFSNNFSN